MKPQNNTLIMKKVREEFLKSKIDQTLPDFMVSGNMYINISRKELYFTVWNILPNGRSWSRENNHFDDTDQLDGHYDVTVNYETFEWAVQQHGTFGNLVSYLPPSDTTVWTKENCSESMIKRIESGVARSILGAVVYTGKDKDQWFIERDEYCFSSSATIFPAHKNN